MPYLTVNGVNLYFQTHGDGEPLVFCHEFAGDARSWQPQVDAFAGRYRCVTFNYRGYPPSDVPEDRDAYSQEHLVSDLAGLLDQLEIERANLVGLSMGGNIVLNFALAYPERCRGIVVAGCGAGSTNRDLFDRDIAQAVELLRTRSMDEFAEVYSHGASRLPFKAKDPAGWERFRRQLAEHSAVGSANTLLGVQLTRPGIFALEERLARLRVPTLLLIGDEDEPCVDPNVFMKRVIPTSGLAVIPQSGHTINLEEPEQFNRAVADFFQKVETGKWMTRRYVTTSLLPPDSVA
jgi:pimeloyl-ACP methyl ester carboxylesterase